MKREERPSLLLVANYPSDVGYAWWLMESFWVKLAGKYSRNLPVLLAYPKLTVVPLAIENAPLQSIEFDLSKRCVVEVIKHYTFLRKHRVKAIYFSDMATWHWCYIIYRFAGVRLIITHDHTPGTRPPVSGWKRLVKNIINRIAWVSVDGAIGATDFVQQRLVNVGCVPAWKCYSAPNGLPSVDLQTEPANLHNLFKVPKERKILVMTGRAHRYKGIEFVLQCMRSYHSAGNNDLQFLFFGDGPDLKHFEKRAKELGCSEFCSFPGRRPDIPSLLEGADIAIHPSQGEVGYSLSILEYMRAGLPVLVPDNPSVCGATMHNKTGIVYPQDDIGTATSELCRLSSNQELRRSLGDAARLSVKKFRLGDTHQALLQAFTEIDKRRVLMPSRDC